VEERLERDCFGMSILHPRARIRVKSAASTGPPSRSRICRRHRKSPGPERDLPLRVAIPVKDACHIQLIAHIGEIRNPSVILELDRRTKGAVGLRVTTVGLPENAPRLVGPDGS
jgi:hypothetical protein